MQQGCIVTVLNISFEIFHTLYIWDQEKGGWGLSVKLNFRNFFCAPEKLVLYASWK
jgi:hypothetical protein